MKFVNIWNELLCKPCLITPEMHHVLCDILEAHMSDTVAIAEVELDEQSEGLQKMGDDIAHIRIAGPIAKHVSGIRKSSGVTDVDDLMQNVAQAMMDDSVKGIFLEVNSPGGSVTGIPEAAEMIRRAAREKYIVAFTDDLMASAAYWLASGADAIYASQSAQVGSIGVYMAWLDESRKYEMEGVKTELIKRGKFKAMGLSGTTLTEEQRTHLQAEVDQVYEWFCAAVRCRRRVAAEAMEGQTYYAEAAQRVKLIDRVGDKAAAIHELRSAISGE